MDLSKLLHGFIKFLHHTKPSWCLTNILKLLLLTSVSCLAIHNWVQKSSFYQTLSRLCDDDTGVWTKDVKRYSMPGSVVHLAKFLKCDIYLVRIFISPKAIQLHIYLAYLEHYLTGARHGEGMVNMERMFLLLTIFLWRSLPKAGTENMVRIAKAALHR